MKWFFFLPVITFAWERLQPLSFIISGDRNLRLYGYKFYSTENSTAALEMFVLAYYNILENLQEILKHTATSLPVLHNLPST